MMNFHIVNPKMRFSPKQAEFLLANNPDNKYILNCGRGFGKGTLARIKIESKAYELWKERTKPNSDWYRSGPIVTIGIFYPYDELANIWDTFCNELVQPVGRAADGTKNFNICKEDSEICLFGRNGICYKFFNCWHDEKVGRGQTLDIVLVDETSHLKNPLILDRNIFPTQRNAYGMRILVSTPQFGKHWWNLIALSAKSKTGDWAEYYYLDATSYDNPKLGQATYSDSLKTLKKNPAEWRKEYCAELFVQPPIIDELQGEKVWSPDRLSACFVSTIPVELGAEGYVCGLDLAWQGRDEAVLTVFCKATGFLCHIERYCRTSNADLRQILEKAYKQWKQPEMYFDNSGPASHAFYEQLIELKAIYFHKIKPVFLRRASDAKASKAGQITKHLLILKFKDRMSEGMIKFPNPESFTANNLWEKLPLSNEADQKANFEFLYKQFLAFTSIYVRTNKEGDEEYFYKPDWIVMEDGKKEKWDDIVDSMLIGSRGLKYKNKVNIDGKALSKAIIGMW